MAMGIAQGCDAEQTQDAVKFGEQTHDAAGFCVLGRVDVIQYFIGLTPIVQ